MPEEQKASEGYFQSLAYLCRHYGVSALEVSKLPYPANIIMSYRHIAKLIRLKGRHRVLQIMSEGREVTLQVTETVDTGHTLYYIPVIPLYHWHRQRANRKTAELLLGVCAYLLQEVGVPYYRSNDSYLAGNYQMMQDWIDDDCGDLDKSELDEQQDRLNQCYNYGDIMGRRIYNKDNLNRLAERLKAYHPVNELQKAVYTLAETTLALRERYPNRNLLQSQNEPPFDEDDNDYDYYSILRIEDYVGFIGETTSSLYDSMIDMINNDLNERSQVLEPELTTIFNNPVLPYQDGLNYEQQIFELMGDLCTVIEKIS